MRALLFGTTPESVPEPETDNRNLKMLAKSPMRLVEMDEPGFLGPDWVVTRPRLTGICGSESKQIFFDYASFTSKDRYFIGERELLPCQAGGFSVREAGGLNSAATLPWRPCTKIWSSRAIASSRETPRSVAIWSARFISWRARVAACAGDAPNLMHNSEMFSCSDTAQDLAIRVGTGRHA